MLCGLPKWSDVDGMREKKLVEILINQQNYQELWVKLFVKNTCNFERTLLTQCTFLQTE